MNKLLYMPLCLLALAGHASRVEAQANGAQASGSQAGGAANAAGSGFSATRAAAATGAREAASSGRLARAPEMFGDSMRIVGLSTSMFTFGIGSDLAVTSLDAAFPLGNLGQKVGDGNSAFPRDRVFYRFSHFEDVASQTSTITDFTGGSGQQTVASRRSLSVHTFGFELSLLEGLASVELRAPFAQRVGFNEQQTFGNFVVNDSLTYGGEGNLYLVTKVALTQGEDYLLSTGLAFDLPTGRDAATLVEDANTGNSFHLRYENRELRISPYLAGLWTPTERLFQQVWTALEVPLSSSRVYISNEPDSFVLDTLEVDRITTWTLDVSTGYWLHRDRSAPIQGVAGVFEVHYNAALEGPVVSGSGFGVQRFEATPSPLGRYDVVNLTAALHFQVWDEWSVRVGAVQAVDDRFFDQEFTVQSILRF